MRSERHWFLRLLALPVLFALPLLCAGIIGWLAWGAAVNGYPAVSALFAVSALLSVRWTAVLVRRGMRANVWRAIFYMFAALGLFTMAGVVVESCIDGKPLDGWLTSMSALALAGYGLMALGEVLDAKD